MGLVFNLVKNCEARDFTSDSQLVQPTKGHVKSTCGSSNNSSVRGILRVACDLTNSRNDSQDALTTRILCVSLVPLPT